VRALLILGALASGGCMMAVTGELPDVEVTEHDVTVPGIARDMPTGDVSMSLPSFFAPTEQLGLPADAYQSVKIKQVSMVIKTGGRDLAFLRSVRLGVSGLQGYLVGAPPAQVGSYERPANGRVGDRIDVANRAPVEVADAWRDSLTVLTFDATGDLPEDDWTVDVIVRLSAVISY
jgi:hypothetical protein